MSDVIRAMLHGGPFDGKEILVDEGKLEMQLDDTTSGRLVITRYVLHYTDKRGVAHYYVPTSSAKL